MSSLDQQISLDEFIRRIHKFRERMGDASLSGEQRRAIKRALVLSYFDMEGTTEEIERASEILNQNLSEYTIRMSLIREAT